MYTKLYTVGIKMIFILIITKQIKIHKSCRCWHSLFGYKIFLKLWQHRTDTKYLTERRYITWDIWQCISSEQSLTEGPTSPITPKTQEVKRPTSPITLKTHECQTSNIAHYSQDSGMSNVQHRQLLSRLRSVKRPTSPITLKTQECQTSNIAHYSQESRVSNVQHCALLPRHRYVNFQHRALRPDNKRCFRDASLPCSRCFRFESSNGNLHF